MLRKNYFLKRKNIWHIILNLFSKSAKWDNKDLIIHSFYDSFKKKSLKDFNFNLIKKYLYKKLSIKSNVCKSVEFVNITKKNLFFNVCAIYLDLDSFSNIDTLINFLKYKNIQICYVNNKNIIINHNFKFYSLRNYNSTNFPIINSLIASYFINNCKIKIAYSSYKIKYYLSKIFNYKKLFDYFLLKSRHLFWKTLISLRLFTKAKNFRFKYLSLEEFLSLKFIDANELNNLMRSSHFDLITNDRKLVFISQIIEFFNKSHNLNFSNSKVVEPKYIELSKYPRHLDRRFWDNGNSQFFNCLLFGFRKNIINYEKLESSKTSTGQIYFSRNYYQSLQKMQNQQIKELLEANPISIKNGSISSGRHRVAAMIGRLIKNENYIPFLIDTLI